VRISGAIGTSFQYNVPGQGPLPVTLYPYTAKIIECLEKKEFIDRLELTDQLGVLRYVYPGAHHTRYEYVATQWALITLLSKQYKGDVPVSKSFSSFPILPDLPAGPSGSDIMQSIALLSSCGYLPDTFAAAKALMHYLRNTPSCVEAYKRGLPEDEKEALADAIYNFDLRELTRLNTVFLLNRIRSPYKEIAEYGMYCLQWYSSVNRNSPDSHQRLASTMRRVRRISYVSLDSHYCPIPFELNLGALFLGGPDDLRAAFGRDLNVMQMIGRFESVLQDGVYYAPKAILQEAHSARAYYRILDSFENQIDTVHAINFLLNPLNGDDSLHEVFHSGYITEIPTRDSDYNTLVYDLPMDEEEGDALTVDDMELEELVRSRLDSRTASVGVSTDRNWTRRRLVVAIPFCEKAKHLSQIVRVVKLLLPF
jgi:hypothetical protein